ncbi:glycoside hydrolase family 3 N-terminal domain-containing protein [Novosphingobium guangzhouense]|uniref:Beta-D-glucoside glucohydrolase n=1 Tax=Novosphingobium guangzhouense TaxID=1850347 RepID=A0A2K2FUX3_9SPHN|nr:glycoside hydrolase family 3 N-terminal domain-containing protein [Novosphingobium guangzhouense]PNU02564.1 beta-glucosidase [Novosphingobium guangzhouense]
MTEAEARTQAEAMLKRMTLEEKAGQLVQYFDFGGATVANPKAAAVDIDASIAKGEVGSMLFVTDPVRINKLQELAVKKTRLGIPLLIGYDVIHGLHTIMPVPIAMAASWDPATAERGQAVAASEARAVGINWTFAPMVDITMDPRWGRMVEGAGEDPVLGAAMAAAQVRGFQGGAIGTPGHVLSGPKHFVGYGASFGGRDYDEVDLSENQLRNIYLPPFKAALDAGAGNIMSAYMGLNGVPAAANKWLLTDVLRKEWGFKGFVVSDANGVNSLEKQGAAGSPKDAAVRALDAGMDLAMSVPSVVSPMLSLVDAVKAGEVPESALDTPVLRLLEAKYRLGLFEKPYVDAKAVPQVFDDPAHREVARIAAERSAVLLANAGGLLPLDRAKLKSVAVIGPLADEGHDMLGPWVFSSNKPVGVSVLAGLRAKLGTGVNVGYAAGTAWPTRKNPSFFDAMNKPGEHPSVDEKAELAKAVDLAKASDVAVMVLGEAQNMAGEFASRSDLKLPGHQQTLLDAVIATGKPVVVVLVNGRPLSLGDARPGAVLEAWYPGSEGGNAVANLLLGDANPGGKLPFSWIRSAGQAPYTYAYLPSHQPDSADKRYWNEDNSPTWPFGHGLSYTTFSYGKLAVDRASVKPGEPVTVSFDLTNTGQRAGDEVAQLYIHQRVGTSSRPVRQLKKFARVALAPGETKHMQFTLTADDLRYWSAVTRGWVQDESAFDVWVGGDSKASMAATFTVAK